MGDDEVSPPTRDLLVFTSSPPPADGAARRIADGAWRRAEELRREPARPAARWARRGAAAAGIAAAAAGALLSLRHPEPAFAVEGDPVQVLDEGRWGESRTVPIDAYVYAGPGARSLVAGDGGRIDPRPGSVFRILRDVLPARGFRVEIVRGDAEVAGSGFVVSVADRVEVSRPLDIGSFEVFVSADGGAGELPPPDADAFVVSSGGTMFVRVLEGAARIAEASGADYLMLSPEQAAVTVDLPSGRRLARSVDWSPRAAATLAMDLPLRVADERGDGGVVLTFGAPGANLFSFSISSAQRDDALSLFNGVALENILRAGRVTHVSIEATLRAAVCAPRTEYELVQDGRRTLVSVETDGTASLERDGGSLAAYPSLAALRDANPDVVAAFGGELR